MNFAEALRRAHDGKPAAAPTTSNSVPPQHIDEALSASNIGLTIKSTQEQALPVEPHSAVNGSVVRLEIFLSAEQLSGLFRAITAGQHSIMTLREAAAYLRVNPSSLQKLADDREVPGVVIDGKWRFPKSSLDDWLTLQAISHEENENVA